jgi:hypothetical protein
VNVVLPQLRFRRHNGGKRAGKHRPGIVSLLPLEENIIMPLLLTSDVRGASRSEVLEPERDLLAEVPFRRDVGQSDTAANICSTC